MVQIFRKEFNGYLNSLIGYAVIGIFLTSIGLLTWVFPDTSVLDYGFADLETLFSMGPYVLIFLVPAITMRSLAEEKKMGTLEWLMTRPLDESDLVLGKFLACWCLVTMALVPTLVYYLSLYNLGNPPGNIDTSGVIGSYIGLVLLGGVFCAMGVFTSSLVSNQILAFLLAAFLCFLLYSGMESVSLLVQTGSGGLMVKQIGILYHYDALSKGLIDLRDVVYFVSVGAFFLLCAKTSLSSRSW